MDFCFVSIRRKPRWIAGMFAVLVTAFGVAGSLEAETAIVPNGNFESDNGGVAEGWEGPWGDVLTVVSDGENKFVRFKQDDSKMRVIKRTIPVDPAWDQIRITSRMRCLDFQRGEIDWQDFRVMYEFVGVDGKAIGGWDGGYPRVTEPSDWKEFSAVGKVPAGTVSISLFPGLFFANGQADLDDIEITVLSRRGVPVVAAAVAAGNANATETLKPEWGSEPVREISSSRGEMCLNGVWRFAPATGDWSKAVPKAGWGFIRVPGSWAECAYPIVIAAEQIAGHGNPWPQDLKTDTSLGRMWYQREVTIPKSWDGRTIYLHFDAVGTDAAVVIGGKEIGKVGYPTGDVDLTGHVRPGEKVLLDILVVAAGPETVAVMMGYNDDGKKVENSVRSKGLLGDVILKSFPKEARVSEVVVQTSFRNKTLTANIKATGLTPGQKSILSARVLDEQGKELKKFDETVDLTGPEGTAHAEWKWADPILWNLESPKMLTLSLELRTPEGKIIDDFREPFGFREFWVDGRDFYLNGVKTRLRPAPHGTLLNAGFPVVFESFIDSYKKMGINFVEFWPEDIANRTAWIYWKTFAEIASRKGILVSGVAPNMQKYLNLGERGKDGYRLALAKSPSMREIINQPSVVMWGHSGNVFNSAFQPQNIGMRNVTEGIMFKSKDQVAHENRIGAQLLAEIRKFDPTRPSFAHHAMAASEIHTANMYLNLIPLQEREEWMSNWANHGQLPFLSVEFGDPLAQVTFLRGRDGFMETIGTEAFPAEYTASYLGPQAYKGETQEFREDLVKKFRGGQKYDGWWPPVSFTFAPNGQQVLSLFIRNTVRSWRTWGLSGGMISWSVYDFGWKRRQGMESMIEMPPFIPGQRGLYAFKLPVQFLHPFDEPGATMTDAGKAYVEGQTPTLAWITGADPGEKGYGGGFVDKTHLFFAGASMRKQIALINDTSLTQNYTAEVSASVGGQAIKKESFKGSLEPGEIKFEKVEFTAPTQVAGGKAGGEILLSAKIGAASHQDKFEFRVLARQESKVPDPISVFDPVGETTLWLKDLGIRTVDWKPGTPVSTGLLIIGRKALEKSGGMPDGVQKFVNNGGRCMIMAQDPHWLRSNLGLRVSWFLSRRAFPIRSDHPVLAGLDQEDLRDWAGNSTLVEAYPDWRTREKGEWEEWFPYAGWRWGNRGALTSAAIETPHHGGWTPVLACEFDMAWSPLIEKSVGKGILTLCMLDLEDHTAVDPAARKLGVQLLDHARKVQPTPPMKTVAVGLGKWKPVLDAMGVRYLDVPSLPPDPCLAIIGPDAAVDQPALEAFLLKGGRAFVVASNKERGGVTLKQSEKFNGSLDVPSWPEIAGIGPSDIRFRAASRASLLTGGCELGADGLFGRRQSGAGVVIFSQLDPTSLDAENKTYLRFTRWRQIRATGQILANLGARFSTDDWFFDTASARGISLTAPWKAKLLARFEAPADFKDRVKESFSDAAKGAVKPGFDDSTWQEVKAPQAWEEYGSEWKNADGEAVFRIRIDVPKSWVGKDLRVELGAIHAFDDTFWNGKQIGRTNTETPMWHKHRRVYTIPGADVKSGPNLLAVRIYNDWADGGFRGVASDMNIGLAKPASLYDADYITDFKMGDDPFRYFNW